MRTIIQRVSDAKVRVDEQEISAIHQGLLLLVGIHQKDTEEQLHWMCEKILKVRKKKYKLKNTRENLKKSAREATREKIEKNPLFSGTFFFLA